MAERSQKSRFREDESRTITRGRGLGTVIEKVLKGLKRDTAVLDSRKPRLFRITEQQQLYPMQQTSAASHGPSQKATRGGEK